MQQHQDGHFVPQLPPIPTIPINFGRRSSESAKVEKVGIVDDPRCEMHVQTENHVERPLRVVAVRNKLKESGLYRQLQEIDARPATELELQMVHSADYIEHVKEICLRLESGFISKSPDLFVANGNNSYISALIAAGGVIEATKNVLYGNCKHAYCNVRPPGHHAFRSKGGGFCIFNNVALGVKEAMKCPRVDRVLVLDWDVHHGDGTADIFKNDPYVMYISTHGAPPFYPGTGKVSDNTSSVLNFPLQKGTSSNLYHYLFTTKILPEIRMFHPDLIFISCGIDAHEDDPVGEMCLTEDNYAKMTKYLKELEVPIVCVLEGGYNVDAVANSINVVVEELLKNVESS